MQPDAGEAAEKFCEISRAFWPWKLGLGRGDDRSDVPGQDSCLEMTLVRFWLIFGWARIPFC